MLTEDTQDRKGKHAGTDPHTRTQGTSNTTAVDSATALPPRARRAEAGQQQAAPHPHPSDPPASRASLEAGEVVEGHLGLLPAAVERVALDGRLLAPVGELGRYRGDIGPHGQGQGQE